MILLIEKRIIVTRFLTLIHCELNQLRVNNDLNLLSLHFSLLKRFIFFTWLTKWRIFTLHNQVNDCL